MPYTSPRLLSFFPSSSSTRWQLIYAWGSPTALPAQQARARACQALLHTLSAEGRRGALGAVLAREGVAVASGPGPNRPGGFQGVHLLPGDALEQAVVPLRRHLAQALLERPPYAMRWMVHHPLQVGGAVGGRLCSAAI